MKILKIRWQRLLIEESGQTCPRCGSTEYELDKAVQILKQTLAPLDIGVILEKQSLDQVTFSGNVLESNKILINDKPLEEWLEAEVGHSPCCDVCGDAECRTVEVGDKSYETIPSDLIIKAALLAASQMVSAVPEDECCEDKASDKKTPGKCCP